MVSNVSLAHVAIRRDLKMRVKRLAVAVTMLTWTSSWAMAAATQEEADRLKASLEKYLSATPGVVAVGASGDSYEVKLDFAPLLAKAKSSDFTFSMSPLAFKLKPKGTGQWDFAQDQSLDFSFNQTNVQSIVYNIKSLKQTGVYDEALGAFSDLAFEMSEFKSTQEVNDASTAQKLVTESSGKKMTGKSKAVANPAGGVDFEAEFQADGQSGKSDLPNPGGQAISFSYDTGPSVSRATGKNVKMKDLNELLAWFVARPSKELIVKDQADLKSRLKSAMPFFENMSGTGDINGLKVTTVLGEFTVASMQVIVDMNGLVKDGNFREAITATGIGVPQQVLPPWAVKLIPSGFTFDFVATGFDAGAPMSMFFDALDLAKDPPIPDDQILEIGKKALPGGNFKIALNPGFIKAPAFNFDYSGDLLVSLDAPPSGKAAIKMTGFDDTIKALQEASQADPSANQAIGPLMAIKGFAKQEGDALVWNIESTPAGTVLVNGLDVSKMMGGP